jgi:hypothetical protein
MSLAKRVRAVLQSTVVVAPNAEVSTTAVTAYDCIAKSFSDDKTLGSH